MPKLKLFGLFLGVLLLAFPATALAAGGRVTLQLSGTASAGDAIDTLTVQGAGALISAAPFSESFIFKVIPGNSANAVRDSILSAAAGLTSFTLTPGPTGNQVIITANGNYSVRCVLLDSMIVPFEPLSVSRQSVQYTLLSVNLPGLTIYGAIVLVVLLVGTALWLFRKRNLKTA